MKISLLTIIAAASVSAPLLVFTSQEGGARHAATNSESANSDFCRLLFEPRSEDAGRCGKRDGAGQGQRR